MSRVAPDLFFSQLSLDYLNSDESAAAGVPGSNVLPKTILDEGLVQSVPALIITASEAPGGNTGRRTIHLLFVILFHNRAKGVDAADDAVSLEHTMERATASQYQDAIESRMMDRAALGAFIAGMDAERRDGFRILKMRRLPQPNIERKEKVKTELFFAFELNVIWYPQVV